MTAHIQIGDIRPRIQYVGTGNQTVFPYPFPIFAQDDLRVYLDDTQVTSGFSVDGAGASDGGAVTFVEAPAAGTRVTLLRHLDIARVTDFQAGGPLRAASLNDALDHLTAVDQQLDDGLQRTVRLAPGAAENADLTLPAPAPGGILGWNETGSALTNDPLHSGGLTDAVATIMAAGGVAAAALDHADRAESWADDAALSAWLTTLNGGGGGGGGGVGPGDDITVASLTTSGNATIGGDLVVGGSTMTVWGRSIIASTDAAAGRTALGLGSAATSDSGDFEAADAMAGHESTHDHGNLPTDDEIAAIQGANGPGAGNVFATMADVGDGGGGTVTSVTVSGSDGIQVDSGSPITTSGTIVLGVDAATLRSHLNVENGATADQSAQEIATAIDADATAESTLQTALGLGSAAYTPATDYATTAQGTLAETAVQPGDNATLALIDYTSGRFTVTATSVGATHTLDLTDGELQPLTLTDDTVFTLPDPPAGHGYSVTLKLIQDATGNRTPSFRQADATAARWLGGSAPAWRTAAGALDVVVLTHDGTDLLAAHVGGTS